GAGSVLQQHRTALDRSRADDAHAHHRLLLRHTLGATAVRGGSSQSGLSMVLPARGSMAESPITPPSPRTGMAGSARAVCCRASLRQSCGAASEKVWLVAKPLPSMPA